MPTAPTKNLQCSIQGGLSSPTQGAQTTFSALWMPAAPYGRSYAGQTTGNHAQFWVLDDRNPMGAAPQQFVAPNASTVPPGLAALMDDKHLLVAGFFGYGTNTPSGALYDFFMDNGAGDSLIGLEQMSTSLACGCSFSAAYFVVSIPGQGPRSGVEFLRAPVPMTYASAQQQVWYTMFGFYLFPDNAGRYLPSRSFGN
jgi:hypothetical protein